MTKKEYYCNTARNNLNNIPTLIVVDHQILKIVVC